jgi:hypothetical protein
MKINITGDFFISGTINEPFELIKNIIPFFKNADLNIVNLESPVTNSGKQNRILKVGPHLNGHPETFNILKMMNVNLATLANNHIMDFGNQGLKDTLEKLEENHISHVGAGFNLKEATKVFTIEKEGFKIGVLNFAENEWSIAEDDKPGANPLDIIENVKQIKAARGKHDKVIVIIHGGHEYYHLPSPRMVKQYRFYAENGADAIIGHHTHCISGYEVYKNVPIFYSLANFLFTLNSKQECWYTGLILQLEISQHKDISFELYPIKQKRKNFNVEFLQETEKEKVIEEISGYNKIIIDNTLIRDSWKAFLSKTEKQYLHGFSPVNIFGNRYIRAGLKRLNFDKFLMRKQNLKEILNLIRCEAHADVSKEIIKKHLKE